MTTKSILSSKTIWGLLVAALPLVASLFGFTLAPGFEAEAQATVDQLVQVAGLVFAAYGRVVATSKLVIKNEKPPAS
jgi:hypothetical protein